MPRESEMLTFMRWTSPRSIRRRIQFAPLISLAALTIFVPLLGLGIYTAAPEEGPPIVSWSLGVALWALSVLLVPTYHYWAVKARRAITAYTLATLALFPAILAILDGALRFAYALLGPNAYMVSSLGFLLGLVTIPFVIGARRTQFRAAMGQGHLKRSLDIGRATWDAQYDNDEALSTEWLKRPGWLIRILPWIGPIIGMRLAATVGRSAANLIMVASFLGGGYALVYFGLVKASVQLLEFRRLEKELGRPILLAEEAASKRR